MMQFNILRYPTSMATLDAPSTGCLKHLYPYKSSNTRINKTMVVSNVDLSPLSQNQMLDILEALAQEVYGIPVKVMQDPVDDMWIIFNPSKKITYVVNNSLQKLFDEFLEEYSGVLEVEFLNNIGAIQPELLN